MKNVIFTSILICVIQFCHAADNYSVGDSLYVWSKGGLNLKAGPHDASFTIKTLKEGKLVVVKQKTTIPERINLLGTKNHLNYEPGKEIIIEGYWVQVEVDGKTGYLHDSFLLNTPTYNQSFYRNLLIAATGKSEIAQSGVIRNDIRFYYSCAIGPSCSTELVLKEWSMEESLVFWFYLTLHQEKLHISHQSKQQISFGDGIESTSITISNGIVKINSTWAS